MTAIKKFFADESGQGMVEYGLIIALIAVVCIAGVTALGGGVKDIFGDAKDGLSGATE